MGNNVKPKVDDQFWFDYSAKAINSAVERRDQAASKIQTLVTWLWGIYTASAAVGFALSGKGLSVWPTLIIASASAALIGVYWATVWVITPVLGQFDPRSPDDIRADFNMLVRRKDRRLKVTLAAGLAAAALVSVALIVASVAEKEPPIAPTFTSSVHTVGATTVLALAGQLPQAKEVAVHIQASGDTAATSHMLTLLKEGVLETSFPLEAAAEDSYDVTVEWTTASGIRIQAAKRVSGAVNGGD
jgi:hypothetical protein